MRIYIPKEKIGLYLSEIITYLNKHVEQWEIIKGKVFMVSYDQGENGKEVSKEIARIIKESNPHCCFTDLEDEEV